MHFRVLCLRRTLCFDESMTMCPGMRILPLLQALLHCLSFAVPWGDVQCVNEKRPPVLAKTGSSALSFTPV